MASGDIRMMVREILAEELSRLRAHHPRENTPRRQIREETVTLRSDGDLMRFVHRILALAADGTARREIEEGRWVFRLSGGATLSTPIATTGAAAVSEVARFDRGLVAERQINALPDRTSVV